MAYRDIELNNIYHVYNRGVEKRDIFLDNEDRALFIHHLFALNNVKRIHNLERKRQDTSIKTEKLVSILGFCLMDNHYHLLLQERTEGGISKFMQKIGTGYTMYFNKKNSRSGALFQGKFKSKEIKTDAQCNYILDYIHMNPLKSYEGGPTYLIDMLMQYRWSSFLDYMGKHNFQSVLDTSFYKEYFLDASGYKNHFSKTLSFKKEIKDRADISDICID